MKKQIISLLSCGVIAAGAVVGLAGCDSNNGDKISLTVWGSAAQQATLKQMVEDFKTANPDKDYNITVGIGEEDMAYSNVSKDASAAADVYCYSNDQLVPLLRIGALARIGGANLETIKAENSEESVASGSIEYGTAEEKVYGYPYASDNGYFMFYNKSVLGEEQVGKLETIISVCESAGKKIGWALDVPWYTAGWFFSYGCSYKVEYDYSKNYTETNIELNGFNTEAGIKASKAMAKLTASSAFAGKGTDNNTITTKLGTGEMAVAVTGMWNAKVIKEKLGDNYGVCKLPTVNVDGQDVQLSSFKGFKLFGVNPHSANGGDAHKLALFLSNEANQRTRFEKHMVGPTNKVAASVDVIKNDATFAALSAQNAFAVNQVSVPSNFWEPLKGYGLNIIDHTIDETGSTGADYTYQKYLDNMVASILG